MASFISLIGRFSSALSVSTRVNGTESRRGTHGRTTGMAVFGPRLQHRSPQVGRDALGLAEQTGTDAPTTVFFAHPHHHTSVPRLGIRQVVDAHRTDDEAVALREASDHRAIRLILPRGENLWQRHVVRARAVYLTPVRVAQLPQRLEVGDLRRVHRRGDPDGPDGDIAHVSAFFQAPL